MSARLCKHLPVLKLLHKASPKQRRLILQSASDFPLSFQVYSFSQPGCIAGYTIFRINRRRRIARQRDVEPVILHDGPSLVWSHPLTTVRFKEIASPAEFFYLYNYSILKAILAISLKQA